MGDHRGMKRAQLHLYYGEGKGKTTAAFGQAVRAWGRGWRVLFVQFLKDSRAVSSEVETAAALGPRFQLLRAACGGLLASAATLAARHRFEVVVLDEALVACHFRFLAAASVFALARSAGGRGTRLLVLTGRWAPAGLLRRADLATELVNVRHPYDSGARPVHGIDY